MANILENSIYEYVESHAIAAGFEIRRGTDRGYPDLEIRTPKFGPSFHAVDIKVSRRNYKAAIPTTTQSRITLYTGNTYFKWPDLHWPGTPRAFNQYESHLDIIMIYTFDGDSSARVTAPEIHVHEPWQIGSRQRSSTTREYIGAVMGLKELREGRGEFDSAAAFYAYWRSFKFKTSPQVTKQFESIIRRQQEELGRRDTKDGSTPEYAVRWPD